MEDVISKDLKDKPKMFWSYIKSRRQESTGVAPLKNKDRFIHSDSSSKVEILNDQFVSAYTQEKTRPTCLPKDPAHTLRWRKSMCSPREYINFSLISRPTRQQGLIVSLPMSWSQLLINLHRYLPDCTNTHLILVKYPLGWKNAFAVPIFKKGEKHVPSNYRPVSLTPIACKVLEHIVHSSVMRHFHKNQILTNKQHGFRARRAHLDYTGDCKQHYAEGSDWCHPSWLCQGIR